MHAERIMHYQQPIFLRANSQGEEMLMENIAHHPFFFLSEFHISVYILLISSHISV